MTRRGILLTPLAALGVQTHSYRVDREFPATRAIDIEVPNGTIAVRATNRKSFRVAADIELSASIPEDLELAKREVRFEPRPDNDVFRVGVEKPDSRWSHYNYRSNVQVEMPAATRLILRGVNGKVQVVYEAAPSTNIFIKNVNGEIEIQFPRPLNADFKMKTMNGHIYSAFDMSDLPIEPETQVTERGMKRIVSRNRYAGGRVGRGGIEVQIEGLNGDIRILERKA
ncbi:hypothetical protein [Bryobacter aggregatus]|uniref:hypothetical protein n=1 Tax=Bryobacter aggregatus TaxID=360054 RepID=UPI0004E1ACF3|nr:hypothetical protein [Bryobacter aggregatus]